MGPRQYGRRKVGRRAVKPAGRGFAVVGHAGKTSLQAMVCVALDLVHESVDPRSWRIRDAVTGMSIEDRDPPGSGSPSLGAADGSGWSSDRLLGPVGCGGRPPCTPGLSTWSSSRSLRSLRYWKPRLGGGFALRCLQRLSGPDLATRRCPERDSRHTRGRSSPILSY